MENIFENILKTKKESIDYSYLEDIISPIMPYYICDHFVGTEIYNLGMQVKCKKNDLLKNNNYNDIKNNDKVQVQVDYFDYFLENIFPIIKNNGIKIILITGQWLLPQIYRSEKTDKLLNDENILFWASQNPIYSNHKKYLALPYGMYFGYLTKFMMFAKIYEENENKDKEIKILNQCASVHDHLPENHIRRKYDIFGINSGPKLKLEDFFNNISKAEFVISTTGDRDDCYRHYESIGLNAIPISNIADTYKQIFEDNMIYSNGKEMFEMVNSKTVNYKYKKPNRDILTLKYWSKKIDERLKKITQKI